MRRQDVTWWFASVGIHVVIALVATLLFYETRAPIARPGMTVLCQFERPRDVVDVCGLYPPIAEDPEPRVVVQSDGEGDFEDELGGDEWRPWILTQGDDPCGDEEGGAGGRVEVRTVT